MTNYDSELFGMQFACQELLFKSGPRLSRISILVGLAPDILISVIIEIPLSLFTFR